MLQFFSWLLRVDSSDEDVRRRGRNLVIMALGLICMALLFVPLLLLQPTTSGAVFLDIGVAVLIYAGVVALARRGLVALGALTFVLVITLAIIGGTLSGNMLSVAPFYMVLPLFVAGLCLRPWQTWLVLALNLAGLTLMILLLPSSPFNEPNGVQIVFGGYILVGIVGLISFLA